MWQGAWLSGWLLVVAPSASTGLPPVPPQYAEEIGATPDWSPERTALGRRLFGDRILSGDRTISCASCHEPSRAFSDGRRTGVGVQGRVGPRNTPTLVNRALGKSQLWDGRVSTLEEQALGPIANPDEMDLAIAEAVARLVADPDYRDAFQTAFGGKPTAERLAAALAAYERTIYSVDAPFDRFLAGDLEAMSTPARRGLDLFGGKARCSECHSGPNLSDELFHSIGIAPQGGRWLVTGKESDRGAFKTPTLRETEHTAPYMHDGSIATLMEVVEYYDKGGIAHANLSPKMRTLGLTVQDKADLVAFLSALSGRIIETPEVR